MQAIAVAAGLVEAFDGVAAGQGFEPNGARSGGLANIRDRVEALHGRLTIESRLGAGTSIRAELPLAMSAVGQ